MTTNKRSSANLLAMSAIAVALFSGCAVTAKPANVLTGSPSEIADELDSVLSIEFGGYETGTGKSVSIVRNSGDVLMQLEIIHERFEFENGRSIITLEAGDSIRVTRTSSSTYDIIALPVRVLNSRVNRVLNSPVNSGWPMTYVIQCLPWDASPNCLTFER